MSAASLIALALEEARAMVERAGKGVVEVTRTSPPRAAPGGPLRVVRERWAGERVSLVVAASVALAEESYV